jgi:hypothetical protein
MVLVKAMMVSTVALSIVVASAQAADPAYGVPTNQTRAAPTNPSLPYSSTRLPGPKAGGSNWIPSSTPYRAPPSAHGDAGGQPAGF